MDIHATASSQFFRVDHCNFRCQSLSCELKYPFNPTHIPTLQGGDDNYHYQSPQYSRISYNPTQHLSPLTHYLKIVPEILHACIQEKMRKEKTEFKKLWTEIHCCHCSEVPRFQKLTTMLKLPNVFIIQTIGNVSPNQKHVKTRMSQSYSKGKQN